MLLVHVDCDKTISLGLVMLHQAITCRPRHHCCGLNPYAQPVQIYHSSRCHFFDFEIKHFHCWLLSGMDGNCCLGLYVVAASGLSVVAADALPATDGSKAACAAQNLFTVILTAFGCALKRQDRPNQSPESCMNPKDVWELLLRITLMDRLGIHASWLLISRNEQSQRDSAFF